MARLTYRSVELNRCDEGTIVLDVVDGFDSEAEVRGTDTVVPGRAGQTRRNRVKHRRVVQLAGIVKGVGADQEEREASYRDLVDELHAIFDPSLNPGALVIHAPYLIPSGTATLSGTRYLNAIWGPFVARHARRLNVEMVSIASPPDWVVDPS